MSNQFSTCGGSENIEEAALPNVMYKVALLCVLAKGVDRPACSKRWTFCSPVKMHAFIVADSNVQVVHLIWVEIVRPFGRALAYDDADPNSWRILLDAYREVGARKVVAILASSDLDTRGICELCQKGTLPLQGCHDGRLKSVMGEKTLSIHEQKDACLRTGRK